MAAVGSWWLLGAWNEILQSSELSSAGENTPLKGSHGLSEPAAPPPSQQGGDSGSGLRDEESIMKL